MSGEIGLGCGMDSQAASRHGEADPADPADPADAGRWLGRWMGRMLLLGLVMGGGLPVEAATAKISKVLPHLVDEDGQHTRSPSLYERDAYQAHLRRQPEKAKGLRFDVRWSVSRELAEGLRLRIELRGTGQPEAIVLERPVRRRPWYDRWSRVALDETTYARLGRLVAWRVSLWRGPERIAEQRSFLW